MTTIDAIGEDGVIELFSVEAGALGGKVLVPNGDDAAAWFVDPKYASVITTDCMVEGIHFDLAYTPPRSVGRKLVAMNLSDIAAMGAVPRYVLLSVSFPGSLAVDVAKEIALGIRDGAKAHGVAVIGGNTCRTTGPIHLTAVLIGRAQPDELVTRRGTQPGDAIYVTGHLGTARAALSVATSGVKLGPKDYRRALMESLFEPEPRVKAGRALAKRSLVHAMCDVSDGLGKDLRHLLVPEGLGAMLQAHALPIVEAVRTYCAEIGQSPELMALTGGEDYELLFTADPVDARLIADVCATSATPVVQIGSVTVSPEIDVTMTDGSVLPVPGGFEHF